MALYLKKVKCIFSKNKNILLTTTVFLSVDPECPLSLFIFFPVYDLCHDQVKDLVAKTIFNNNNNFRRLILT